MEKRAIDFMVLAAIAAKTIGSRVGVKIRTCSTRLPLGD